MAGVLPESKHELESPSNLWSVFGPCWEVNRGERATGIMVVRELETVIATVEGTSISEEGTPTTELSLVAIPRSDVHRQGASQPQAFDSSPRWVNCINITNRLYTQFTENRNRADLDTVITYQEEALRLRPPGHPDRSGTLHDTTCYIYERYIEDGNRAGLDTAVTYAEEVLWLRPPGYPHRSATLHNMAHFMDERYTENRNRADLNTAIAYSEEALRLRPPGHPDRTDTFEDLALYIDRRSRADKNSMHPGAVIANLEEVPQLRSLGQLDRSATPSDIALYTAERGNKNLDNIGYHGAPQLKPQEHSSHLQTVWDMASEPQQVQTVLASEQPQDTNSRRYHPYSENVRTRFKIHRN
ncbi:hypothetical protein FRB95_004318 [Tulasnella sp. JGI-2019a]|nr:hypothetical protein FRB95_004318 [Tulasnella sp. JGI-2019a]